MRLASGYRGEGLRHPRLQRHLSISYYYCTYSSKCKTKDAEAQPVLRSGIGKVACLLRVTPVAKIRARISYIDCAGSNGPFNYVIPFRETLALPGYVR